MNTLKVFDSTEFGSVRVVELSGEPWFVGKDVASALGYRDSKSALADHVDPEDKKIIQRGQIATFEVPNRGMTVINESGLYSLILSSKMEGAKKFKRWVTGEVIPAIRNTGSYTVNADQLSYMKASAESEMEKVKVRKAELLLSLADSYDGHSRQILQAYATKELTGEFALPLPKSERATYSAKEIGSKIGISASKVGRIAKKAGLKTDVYGAWFLDKSPYSNKEVRTFRYYESVIPEIKTALLSGIGS